MLIKFFTYFFRTISLPFYMAIVTISLIRLFFKHCYNWLLHGGEAVAYVNKSDRATIHDIYTEMIKERKPPL